jgi:hypothetical protein
LHGERGCKARQLKIEGHTASYHLIACFYDFSERTAGAQLLNHGSALYIRRQGEDDTQALAFQQELLQHHTLRWQTHGQLVQHCQRRWSRQG